MLRYYKSAKLAIQYIKEQITDYDKNCQIHFDDTVSVWNGKASDSLMCKNNKIYIGTQELKHPFSCNMKHITTFLVTIYHELQHIKQKQAILNETAPKEITINNLACEYNPAYYHTNYRYNPREIEAETYGISNAYDYIDENFPNENAFNLIMGYAREKSKISNLYDHIDLDKVKSIDDLLEQFQDLYELAKTKHMPYLIENASKTDEAAMRFKRDEELFHEFCDTKTNYEKDTIVSKISLEKHKELSDNYDKNPEVQKLIKKMRPVLQIEGPPQKQEDEFT